MNIDKRIEERIRKEIAQLESLQTRSKFIRFEFLGNPIRRFIVTYTCTGVYLDNKTREVRRSSFHQMEAILTKDYPRARPLFRFTTPIFHPNISTNNDVCLGDVWDNIQNSSHNQDVTRNITDFILDIGEMIQYKRYNLDNQFNSEAVTWAKQNMHVFPIGRENLVEPEKSNFDFSTDKKEAHSVVINNPQNVNLNIATTLSDVRQSINNIQTISQRDKDDFEKLILQLMHELQKAPKEKLEEAESVAEYAKELVDEVSKETPKKIKVNISKEGLIKAAENIANVLPMVLQIAKQIINHIVASS